MSRNHFPARYPGRCLACEGSIEVEDPLRFDEDGTVVHADCATEARTRYRPPTICPDCHLTKPCDCEDER